MSHGLRRRRLSITTLMTFSVLMAGGKVEARSRCDSIRPENAKAFRATGPINLDGNLKEPDWQRATPVTALYEIYPGDCSTPTERSQIRFLYDDKYLYVGFRALLRDPSKLRKPFVRRDKVGSNHDYMQVYLDPQGAGQASYLFRTNARGTRTDGLQDEAKQTESTDPDFDWDVSSAIGDAGWTAELRVPFTTLRIARHGPQAWKFIVTRGVPRDQNTQMATAPFPHDQTCFLCYAGDLVFEDLKPRSVSLLLEPSIVSTVTRNSGSFGSGTHPNISPGLDAKWLPYAGAALDLTINPDFSQVESDSPLLTANQRFALTVPEKRPFFREGSDLIGTPIPALYTRAIVAPSVGLRFTHRSAVTNGTIFFSRDRGGGSIVEPGLLFSSAATPARVSTVAFAHLTRQLGSIDGGVLADAKVNEDGSRNLVAGADFSLQLPNNHIVGQLLHSDTRNPDRTDLLSTWAGQRLRGNAALLEWDRTGSLNSTVRITHYGPDFRAWLGNVPRVGYDDLFIRLQKPRYWSGRWLNVLSPYVSSDLLRGSGARGRERDLAVGTFLAGAHNLSLDLSVHPATRVLTEQGDERSTHDLEWTMSVNPIARVPLISLNGSIGTRVDNETGVVVPAATLQAIVRVRPRDRFEIEGRYSLLRLSGINGSHGARLLEQAREVLATYFIGPAFYLLADAQLYSVTRNAPSPASFHRSLVSLQVNWEMSSHFKTYLGIRTGAVHPDDPSARGRSTDVYVKLVRDLLI